MKIKQNTNANRYITEYGIRNTKYYNTSIHRLASDDANIDSSSTSDVLAGSANSSSTSSDSPQARRNFDFITESYRKGAAHLASGAEIFYAKFSLKKPTLNPERLQMNIDIVLTAGDKPLKYTVNMVSRRFRYELTNRLPEQQSEWSGWQQILDLYDTTEGSMLGRLRNRSTNTSIVPRHNIPFCVAGIVLTGEHLDAMLWCRDNVISTRFSALDPALPEHHKASRYFTHQAEYRNRCASTQTEYDLSELENTDVE